MDKGIVMEIHDITCFGGSAHDVFVQIDKWNFKGKLVFLPGSKVEIQKMEFHTGGGATNTAVGFSRLGLSTAIVSAVGNDVSGNEIRKELEKEKVDCKNLFVEKQKPTAYSVIITGFQKNRVILSFAGASALIGKQTKINLEKISSKWVYVSSLHQKPVFLKKILMHAKKKKIKVAFNPGNAELSIGLNALKRWLKNVEVLLLNAAEAQKLAGKTSVKENLLLLSKHCKTVAITNGEKKVFAASNGKIFSLKPFEVKVLDVTGAGDAFGCGFVAALAKGKDVPTALLWGNANACSVVQFLGTKNVLLSEKGIERFLEKHL